MMRTSDDHLEEALAEYNDKVNALEINGTPEELLEAYVNRSTILMLMDSYISSLSDLDEAVELMGEMSADGKRIDLGTYVKVYENRGQLLCEDNNDQMVDDYARISSRLNEMTAGIRHYDMKGIVLMCLGCAEDLIDEGFPENSRPFTDKAISVLSNKNDEWAANRLLELYNLIGQSNNMMELTDEAVDAFTKAIYYGEQLYDRGSIDDSMEIVFSYVARGDIMGEREDNESQIRDHEAAIEVLEVLNGQRKLDDIELLINLHQGVATAQMKMGMIEEAEKHLLMSINHGMPDVKRTIDDLGLRDR
ncbi:MAG: hypothetical protein WC067_05935 [Candidatus Methanomethylophilaceae archaeon]